MCPTMLGLQRVTHPVNTTYNTSLPVLSTSTRPGVPMSRLGGEFKRTVNQLIVGYLGREKYIATANALIKESGLDDYSNDRFCGATLEEIVAEFQSRQLSNTAASDADARAPEEPQPQQAQSQSSLAGPAITSSSPASSGRNALELNCGGEWQSALRLPLMAVNGVAEGAAVVEVGSPPLPPLVSPKGTSIGLSAEKGAGAQHRKRGSEGERAAPKASIGGGGSRKVATLTPVQSPSSDERHSFSPPPSNTVNPQRQTAHGSGAKKRRRDTAEVERYEHICRERHVARLKPVEERRKAQPSTATPTFHSTRAPLRSPPVVCDGSGIVESTTTSRPLAPPSSEAPSVKRARSPHRSVLSSAVGSRKMAPPPPGGYTKPSVNLDNLLGLADNDNDRDGAEKKREERRPAATTVSAIPVPYEVKKFGGSLTHAKLGIILNKAEKALAVRQAEMNRTRQFATTTMRPPIQHPTPATPPRGGNFDASSPDDVDRHTTSGGGGFSGDEMEKLRRLYHDGPITESLIDKALDMAHGVGGN